MTNCHCSMLRPKNNKTKPRIKHRPFLKWAGGKFRLTDDLNRVFPKRKQCLIEPFVGAGAVFLNSHFERYILADINPDLINLFKYCQRKCGCLILRLVSQFSSPKMRIQPTIITPSVMPLINQAILSSARCCSFI